MTSSASVVGPTTQMIDILLQAGDALKGLLARHAGTSSERVDSSGLVAGTAEAVHGQMNHDQTFGKGDLGKGYNQKVRAHIKSPEARASRDAYKKAYEAYFGLPNEADAKEAQQAFAALCPEAN